MFRNTSARIAHGPTVYLCAGLGTLLVALASTVVAASPAVGAGTCSNEAFRVGPSERLPDCRAYEMVSPVNKNGLDVVLDTEFEPGFVGASLPAEVSDAEGASEGTTIVYQSSAAFAGTEGNELPNAYIARRSSDGWQTQAIAPPTPQPAPPGGTFLSYDFAPDLSQVVIKVPLQRLAEGASEEVYNLYLRRFPENSYSLVSGPPLVSPPANCSGCHNPRAFSGASTDFRHILFEAIEALVPGAPEGRIESLYESYDGKVKLVGVLPDGAVATGPSAAGAGLQAFYNSSFDRGASNDVSHAISEDGSRVFFSATADGGIPDPGQAGLTELYERIEGSKTIEISAPAKGAAPANPTAKSAQFWAASADGELVYFTSSAELTSQSNTGTTNASADLYRYNTSTEELTDLTVDQNPIDNSTGAGVLGVVGASEDGAYVYFVASGQLVGHEGVDGRPNLYIMHENRSTHLIEIDFIATLDGEDEPVWTDVPALSQSYTTPDGLHLAFVSTSRVTGYDNEDQNVSGQMDSEIYEYGAAENRATVQLERGRLVCVSCDPGGQRPVGSASIGVRTGGVSANTPFYRPRVLSDDGSRLFFSSPDPLLPGLSTGHPAILEYEHGDLGLIADPSSGTSDIFLDASPSGNDVFFATRDQLVPADQDRLVDIYDARAGGGLPESLSGAQCAGDACQLPYSPPPTLAFDISTHSSGSGNLVSSTTKPAAKKKKIKVRSLKVKRKRRLSTKGRKVRKLHGGTKS
jgi:hypothetical protein